MKIATKGLIIGTIVVLWASAGLAGEGSETLTMPASKGSVSFPHWKHQVILKDDCSKCHTKDPGKIDELGKEWGHATCRGCHLNEIIESKKGPVTCFGCHKRPE